MDYKSKEVDSVAVSKTLCMLLVVLGHAASIYANYGWGNMYPSIQSDFLAKLVSCLSTFHTQTFTFASGYLFYLLRYEKDRYRMPKVDFSKRITRLAIPYIILSAVWAIPFGIFFERLTPALIIRNYACAINPAQLWFLLMIFGEFAIFYSLSDMMLKHIKLSCTVLILLYYSTYLLSIKLPMGIFQLGVIIRYAFFYFLGLCFRKQKSNRLLQYRQTPVLSLVGFVVLFGVCSVLAEKLLLVKIMLEPALSVLGILMVISFSYHANEMIKGNRLLYKAYTTFSEVSMGVYLLHQQLMYVSVKLYNTYVQIPALTVLLSFLSVFTVTTVIVLLIRGSKIGRLCLGG